MNKERARNILYFVVSLVMAGGIFGYLLTHVSFRDVLGLIRDIDPGIVWIFLILSLSMSVFRTWRYDLVLRSAGYAVSRPALFLIVLVRNFCSDILPARIGSVVYIYLVNSRLNIPFAPAASSFALAFIFDIIALAPMIGVAALWCGAESGLSVVGLVSGGVALLALSVVLLLAMPVIVRRGADFVGRCMFIRESRRINWSSALQETAEKIVEARRAGIYGRLLVISFVVRIVKYGSLYVLLYAMLKPLGYNISGLSMPRVFLGLCSCELAASMPVGNVIGMGAYEGTWAFVFVLLGFPSDLAMQTSISHHLFSQVYGYSLGMIALLVLLIPLRLWKGRIAQNGGDQPQGRRIRFALQLILITAATLGTALTGNLLINRMVQPRYEMCVQGPTPEEAAALTQSGPAGRIYFDSNRSGTFGIWSINGDGSGLRMIVDTDRAEMFPDISPGGRKLVYASAMSPHRLAASEIWICAIDGSNAERLVVDGTFPTFSADGSSVYFERRRSRVMVIGLDGKGERELFPAGNMEFNGKAIVKPRVSPDGRWVAFISDRGGRWNSWAVDLSTGESLHIGKGCEPTWFPDGRRIAFVNDENGRGGSGIQLFNLQGRESVVLQDASEPWGHEYFPCVSSDSRYLFWSACPPGQHSHEKSNYQLFVRDMREGKVLRLTFDGYNNRWPKWKAASN